MEALEIASPVSRPPERRGASTLAPCPVCGCARVRRDAVDGGEGAGALLLGECTRCDHRWTDRAARPAPLRAERRAPGARTGAERAA